LESELLESSKKISELVKQIGLLESNLKNKRTEFEQESKNFSGIDSKFNVEQYKEFSLRNELNDKQNVLLSLEKSMISFKEIKDGLEHQRKETEIKLKDLTKKISDMNNELKKLGSLDTLKQKVSCKINKTKI
jgi:chromosome segregation ATPase